MWNNQYGNILQKEFGFYFSSDNEAYPNVWISFAIRLPNSLIHRRQYRIYPVVMQDATYSRGSSTFFLLRGWDSMTVWIRWCLTRLQMSAKRYRLFRITP